MFDLNGNGKMDMWEWMLLDDLTENDAHDEEEDMKEQLLLSGLDCDDLTDMEEDERRKSIEDAGLDPDDFDALF